MCHKADGEDGEDSILKLDNSQKVSMSASHEAKIREERTTISKLDDYENSVHFFYTEPSQGARTSDPRLENYLKSIPGSSHDGRSS